MELTKESCENAFKGWIRACRDGLIDVVDERTLKQLIDEHFKLVELHKQTTWERDIAVKQLHELRCAFGEKVSDRDTPKKPIQDDPSEIRYVQTYTCPACGGHFSGTISKYCYHCGQRLDWSCE